jgi:hypothetical protein
MGGSNDPSNLVEVSVEEHANLHLALYLEYGYYEDWLACMCLSGQITNAEANRLNKLGDRNPAKRPEVRKKLSQKRKTYNSWNKLYEIHFANGSKCVTDNLKKWARDNGYSPEAIRWVGRGKYTHHHDIVGFNQLSPEGGPPNPC